MNLKGLTKTLTELETLQQKVQDLIDANDENQEAPKWEDKDEQLNDAWLAIDQAKELLEEIKKI